jgi:hypothetical protein
MSQHTLTLTPHHTEKKEIRTHADIHTHRHTHADIHTETHTFDAAIAVSAELTAATIVVLAGIFGSSG